jgi:hypothetical protein
MFRKTNSIAKLTAAAAIVALAVPAGSAARFDLRNPDTKDAGSAVQQNGPVDLRSPDTRDAGSAVQNGPVQNGPVDLRSPDTRDAGIEANSPKASPSGAPANKPIFVDLRNPDTRDAAQPSQSSSYEPQIVQASDFDWGAAAIGAGSVLGLLLIGMSMLFVVNQRRSHGVTT